MDTRVMDSNQVVTASNQQVMEPKLVTANTASNKQMDKDTVSHKCNASVTKVIKCNG